mgnify:FL=1
MDLIICLLIVIIPALAQLFISVNYNKYKKIFNESKITGQEVARKILDKNNLEKIYVVATGGNLTDHYDSSRKVIRLSKDIYDNESIASLAVAAHECGHAIQDKDGYFFMRLRSFIYPIVRIGTMFSYLVIFIGAIAEAMNIIYLGIALVALGLIFQLVTLPVEFDASKRALIELKNLRLVTDDELDGAKKMLISAALTYVAGVLSSALELLRLILIFTDKKD